MPSLSLLHRTPAFDFEGQAARRRRRRERFVAVIAFILSLGALAGTAIAWAIALGFGGIIGAGLAPLVG